MARRTQEQIDADNLLNEAINEVIAAYELMPDSALVQDFVVVVEGMEFNQEDADDPTERYVMLFKDNYIRMSVLHGILSWASRDAIAQQDEGVVDG